MSLERVYEGPEALASLLSASGCELTVDEVVAELEAAVEEGTPASEIIPLLWEQDPRFPSQAAARRTFSNLLGLYELIAADAVADLVVLGPPDPDAPLTPQAVELAWAELDALARPELRRARDRFDNVQSDGAALLFETLAGASDVAHRVALQLAFELWWLVGRLRGPRPAIPRAAYAAALAEEAHEAGGAEVEPALAGHVTTVLWEEAAHDSEPLDEAEIPRIEQALRAWRRALVTHGTR